MILFAPKSFLIIFCLAFLQSAVRAADLKPEQETLLSGLVYGLGQETCVCADKYEDASYLGLFSCGHFLCATCVFNNDKKCPFCRYKGEIFFLDYEDLAKNISPQLLLWQMSDGVEETALKLLNRLFDLRKNETLSEPQFLEILNTVDSHFQTALHRAVIKKWEKVARFLVEANAIIDAKDRNNFSPYEIAVKKKFLALRKLLKPRLPIKVDWEEALSWRFAANRKVWKSYSFTNKLPPRREVTSKTIDKLEIFVEGGVLEKYDFLYGSEAFAHERAEENKVIKNICLGHGAEAAAAACVFDQPNRSVMQKNQEKIVFFYAEDVGYLLVKIIPHLVHREFVGRHHDAGDKTSELSPELFLKTLIDWKQDKMPVVLDFNSAGATFSLPCDEIIISEIADNSDGKLIKYYKTVASGADYQREFTFSIEFDRNSEFVKSTWLKEKGENDFPRAMWRPHREEDLKNSWQKLSVANPFINSETVLEMYKKSIRKTAIRNYQQ